MLYPIIPESIIKSLKIFNLTEGDIDFSTLSNHNYLKFNSKINKIEILFKKIEKSND